MLGFSAGVMIYVSMIEIFAKHGLHCPLYMEYKGYWVTVVAFFIGIAIIGIIDKLVPEEENPHEIYDIDEMNQSENNNKALLRMGILSALAIAIHNFPEGLATYTSALHDPTLGVSIAVAIAIHNIPERYRSVCRFIMQPVIRKSIFLSFLSGLSEPFGRYLIGYFLLSSIINDAIFGLIFASVAGIMVYISLDELLPTAEKYGEHHIVIAGLIAGMGVMAFSLLMFA